MRLWPYQRAIGGPAMERVALDMLDSSFPERRESVHDRQLGEVHQHPSDPIPLLWTHRFHKRRRRGLAACRPALACPRGLLPRRPVLARLRRLTTRRAELARPRRLACDLASRCVGWALHRGFPLGFGPCAVTLNVGSPAASCLSVGANFLLFQASPSLTRRHRRHGHTRTQRNAGRELADFIRPNTAVATPPGFEPGTFSLEGCCSIP